MLAASSSSSSAAAAAAAAAAVALRLCPLHAAAAGRRGGGGRLLLLVRPLTRPPPQAFQPRRTMASKRGGSRHEPYSYYTDLGVPHSATSSEVKTAYYRAARRCHPDAIAPDTPEAEAKRLGREFQRVTEAYNCLTDVTQRSFYDRHGHPPGADVLESAQQSESIFDFRPKYDVYHAQPDTKALDDWFRSQGHSVDEEKISWRQRAKNAWVEYQWGLKVHDFPWRWKEFVRAWLSLCAALSGLAALMAAGIRAQDRSMPEGHPYKVRRINDTYKPGAQDERDILSFLGIRDKGKSRQQLTELYEDEEEEKDGDEKKGRKKRHPSQERDTLESNARRALKSSNLERHERRLREAAERKRKMQEARADMLRRERAALDRKIRALEEEVEEEEKEAEEAAKKKKQKSS